MTDLMFTHYSGDIFLSVEAFQEDVDRLTGSRDRHWITMTEVANAERVQAIRDVVGRRYQVVNPDKGDIAFLVSRDLPVVSAQGVVAVGRKPGPASKGGHGPRFVSEFATEYDGEAITVLGSHLVRANPKGGGDQTKLQVQHLAAIGKRMSQVGKGQRLAIASADLNGSLPQRGDLQAVMDHYHLTTTAHETGTQTPTHDDHRIDYVWTRDADSRLVVNHMEVRRGPAWHTDHDPIDVWATIR